MPSRATRWLLVGLALGLTASAATPAASTAAAPVFAPAAAPPPAPVPTSSAPASPSPQPNRQVIPRPRPRLDPATVTAAVQSVQATATVGALVIDRATGAELVAVEPDRQFRSASLVKLLVAIDAVQRGADERVRRQITTMLRVSHDGIASALWSAGGGAELVTRIGAQLGLTGTAPPSPPGQWGNVLLTARDVGRIYQFVLTGLPPEDRALIIDSLADAPRIAADGFNQHFGIPDALPGPWAIKQGWSNSRTDIVLHSSGLVGPDWAKIVVVLTEHPLRVSWRTAAVSVTAGAKALSPVL
ncbi:MAG TPA: hypothetical protein VGX25_34710 [Actinophytocola sp.]|uniref:hypothetical protein n=1 Tax=Actinophytocola sp. TaxID=1872138 RepID=UPI002DDDA808|nr:hypothetical protein [Actinophytocola sp.]HEV2784564.1 hypothetical protein [Actinophytocola sp.]